MAVSVTQQPSNSSASAKEPGKNGFVNALAAELDVRIVGRKVSAITADFNALDPKLDIGDFVRLGLPPRPADPAALQLWMDMVSPGLKIVTPFQEGAPAGLLFRTDMVVGVARSIGA